MPKIGILRNENTNSARYWIEACKSRGVQYRVIDMSANDWLAQVQSEQFDFLASQPSGSYERYKTMYDERLYYICQILNLKTFPNYTECLIYENKKMLSYYLQSKAIPHPRTRVFYNRKEALDFIREASYPFVAKTSIGASGAGVKIIKRESDARSYVMKAFKGRGIRRRFGPNPVTGTPRKWARKTIKSPKYFLDRMKLYLEINRNFQKGYVIFQEYIQHDYEWRIVKIGESYFAHKKVKVKDKASGGKIKQFGYPRIDALEFVEDLCKDNGFNCVCVDLFESGSGFLVNEIQCIFGIPYGYLMKVDDEVGRMRKIQDSWVFEKGDFTTNECYDLRLDTALTLFELNN